MDTLKILQNRAVKIILGRDLRDSATQALKDLNWLTLVKKRTIDRCIFVNKCLKQRAQIYKSNSGPQEP